MVFNGRHGVPEAERDATQPFEVDVELSLDLRPAGLDDDLARTVDYSRAFDVCREIVETTSFRLLEALAEAIAQELLTTFDVGEVRVRVRKPRVSLPGPLAYAGVEIVRLRSDVR